MAMVLISIIVAGKNFPKENAKIWTQLDVYPHVYPQDGAFGI